MVHLFNRTIKNILQNYIPHEIIPCDDRGPLWINSSIMRLIQDKMRHISALKEANVVPVHLKKNEKQLLKNYPPISLLPICRKVLERLLYNSMFEFFIQNNLITPNQSDFKTGDSCLNQLYSITHEICKSFDDGYEVRRVFLDISKAFEKVWHQGLHYKLRQNGISGELLNTLTDFLDNRTQRVILNGQYSSWAKVEAGVPQG